MSSSPILDPAAIQALTARLVAVPSVSPDVDAETRCARAIVAALPPGVEHGTWPTLDGRPVVWAFVPGATAKTVVLLGHYDVVGVSEFAALGLGGEALAFDPARLRERLLALAHAPNALDPDALADLKAEEREPGTWMFGRGAFDMKSGVAIGVELLRAARDASPGLGCGVLFVVTPDEEHESAGMIAALDELVRFRAARVLELVGVLNLDSGAEHAAYVGMMGKLEVACYVQGVPTHVGLPFEGVDAAELAAAIVTAVARSRAMIDEADGVRSPPAVTLRLRDLKSEYNVQTAREAMIEFNVITVTRPLEATLDLLRTEAVHALQSLMRDHLAFAASLDPERAARAFETDAAACVMTYGELLRRAGREAADDPLADPALVGTKASALDAPRDARAATLARLRALCRAAGITGPAVVLHLVPPFYPHAAPGQGLLVQATRDALAGERGVSVRPYFPYISDACYAAWRAEPIDAVTSQMPSFGREYYLPARSAQALDLDVVNLGPWGRDAHGLLERVHAGYTFGRLPQLLWNVLNHASTLALAAEGAAERKRP